jgi:hypothetical protein
MASRTNEEMPPKYILDRILLEKRLKELAETPYAGEMCYGAMCYVPAYSGAPFDEGYFCPICEKTTKDCNFTDETMYNLETIRQIITELKATGFDIWLDERDFCNFCREKEPPYGPKPFLMIRFNPNDEYHRVKTFDILDYKILKAFLESDDHCFNEYGATQALHDKIDVIDKMTNLGEDIIKTWKPTRQ